MNPNIFHHVTPGARVDTGKTKCRLRYRPRMNITTDWDLVSCGNCARSEYAWPACRDRENTGFQRRFQAEGGDG